MVTPATSSTARTSSRPCPSATPAFAAPSTSPGISSAIARNASPSDATTLRPRRPRRWMPVVPAWARVSLLARGLLGGHGSPLGTRARVRARFLVRDRGGANRVHADHAPRLVHHLEHVRQAPVRRADEPAVAIAVLSEVERDARDAAPAHL